MNWPRIQAAATPMEVLPREQERRTSGHEAATLVLVLTTFALNVWLAPPAPLRVPEIVRPLPPLEAWKECVRQNAEDPQCQALGR